MDFGLGYPESQDQYEQLANTNRGQSKGDRYSDGSLMILTSHKNAQIKVTFQNSFPVTLSGIQLDSSVAEVDYVTQMPLLLTRYI